MNYDSVLEVIDVGILVTNERGEITFANDAAHALVGVGHGGATGDMLVGKRASEVLELSVPLEDLGTGASRRFDARVLGDGDDTCLDVDVTVRAHEGGWVFEFRDVSEERRLQAEMQRIDRLAAIGTMVAGFAHEVRNPVASLRAITEALEEELRDRGLALPHTTRMKEVLGRIERLVRTSLEFGRPAEPRRARHAPAALVQSALAAIAVRTTGGAIHVDVPADLPSVLVDEGQFVQVLVILLSNALDAAGAGSKVAVRVFLEEASSGRKEHNGRRLSDPPPGAAPERRLPRVRFEVVDAGPGIASAVLARVFDAFFTTKASGTGLGLAIAQKIVSENGAHIEIASPGAPTIFAITCPAA